MSSYQKNLNDLDERLGMCPEDNLVLLEEYRKLAEKAREERTEAAGEALLSIAYTIGERISSEEDLEPYYLDAIAILEQSNDKESYISALDSLAWYLMSRDRVPEALSLFESIVDKKDSVAEADYFSLSNLATAYESVGKIEDALKARTRALDTWNSVEIQVGTPDVAFYAQARTEMGRLLCQLGKHEQAEYYFRSVFEDSRNSFDALSPFGRWHQDVVDKALDLVCCLFHQNKLIDAKEFLVREMPESLDGLDEMGRMFGSIAQQCYQQALRDLECGNEPSLASRPGTIISKGFMSENN